MLRTAPFALLFALALAVPCAAEAPMLAMLGVNARALPEPAPEPPAPDAGTLPVGEYAEYGLSGKKGIWWSAGKAATKIQEPTTIDGRRCHHVSVYIEVTRSEPQKQYWEIYADAQSALVVRTEVKKTDLKDQVFEEYVDRFDHGRGTVHRRRSNGAEETLRGSGGTLMVAMWLPFYLRAQGGAMARGYTISLVNDPQGAFPLTVSGDASSGFHAKSSRIELKFKPGSLVTSYIWLSGLFSSTVKLELR